MNQMRRGCVAVGETKCDICDRSIEHGERYLLIDDDENEGESHRFCVDCCLNKGYATYIIDKGEEVLTFFVEETYSQ